MGLVFFLKKGVVQKRKKRWTNEMDRSEKWKNCILKTNVKNRYEIEKTIGFFLLNKGLVGTSFLFNDVKKNWNFNE